jgi:SAM-dependent methyltransferase
MYLSLRSLILVSLFLGQAARAEPAQVNETESAQADKSPASKPAQRKVIVQPADSIPPPDQLPDCIFAPSPPKAVDAILKLADVRPGEVLFDLGSGDGRICIAAAKKYGARAYGYEIQADLVKQSLENVKKNKVEELVTIERRDIFKLDLSGADVITIWLLPALNAYLIPQLDKMKPGSRIVSLDFDMCGLVEPERVIELEVEVPGDRWLEGPRRKALIYLWKTPLRKDEKAFRRLLVEIKQFQKEREKTPRTGK